jgi:hypothetical protein
MSNDDREAVPSPLDVESHSAPRVASTSFLWKGCGFGW